MKVGRYEGWSAEEMKALRKMIDKYPSKPGQRIDWEPIKQDPVWKGLLEKRSKGSIKSKWLLTRDGFNSIAGRNKARGMVRRPAWLKKARRIPVRSDNPENNGLIGSTPVKPPLAERFRYCPCCGADLRAFIVASSL